MDKEELKELLDGRSGAWLGRKLGFKRPKQHIWNWISGGVRIPHRHVQKIRELLSYIYGKKCECTEFHGLNTDGHNKSSCVKCGGRVGNE